jgi:hypothetical protein
MEQGTAGNKIASNNEFLEHVLKADIPQRAVKLIKAF